MIRRISKEPEEFDIELNEQEDNELPINVPDFWDHGQLRPEQSPYLYFQDDGDPGHIPPSELIERAGA